MSDFMTEFAQFRRDFADIIDRDGNGIDDRLEGGLSDAGPVPTEMVDPARVQAQQPAMNFARNAVTLGGFDAYQRGDTLPEYLENTARGAIGGAAKAAAFVPEMAQKGAEYVGSRMGMPDLAPNIERTPYTAADEEFSRNPYAGGAALIATPSGAATALGGAGHMASRVITPTTVGTAGAAGAGATLFAPSAIGQDADALPQLLRDLATLQQKRTQAEQMRTQNTPRGRNPERRSDPRYFSAVDDIAKFDADMEALKAQIGDERQRRERMDTTRNAQFAERRSLGENERRKALDGGRTFREAFGDEVAQHMPFVAMAVPGVLGAAKGFKAASTARQANSFLDKADDAYAANRIEDAMYNTGLARASINAAPKASWGSEAAMVGGSAVEGALVSNFPFAYDLAMLPAYNPEKLAAQKYLEQLHPDDPDRASTNAFMQSLPDDNARRKVMFDELADTPSLLKRLGMGAAEGVGGYLLGRGGSALAMPSAAQQTARADKLNERFGDDFQQRVVDTSRRRQMTLDQPDPVRPALPPPPVLLSPAAQAAPPAQLPPPSAVAPPVQPAQAPAAIPRAARQPSQRSTDALTPAQRRAVQDDLLGLHEHQPGTLDAMRRLIDAGPSAQLDEVGKLVIGRHGVKDFSQIGPILDNAINLARATAKPRELAEKLRKGEIKKLGLTGAAGGAGAAGASNDEAPRHHSYVQPRNGSGQFDGPPAW